VGFNQLGHTHVAGEHTCKEHPDTVGGAMLTGMREAARALGLLRADSQGAAAAAAEVGADRAATGVTKSDKRKIREEGEPGDREGGRRGYS
jgi:hypothetical protein